MDKSEKIWEIMGFLDGVEENQIEDVVSLYDDLTEFIYSEKDDFDIIGHNSNIQESWESLIPKSPDANFWSRFKDLPDNFLNEMQECYAYNEEILISLCFDLIHEMVKMYHNFNLNDFLFCFERVYFKSFDDLDPNQTVFKTYTEIYDFFKQVALEQFKTFYEIFYSINQLETE